MTQLLQNARAGVVPTLSDLTAVKRLIFWSQTLTIANLRVTLQSSDDSGEKRIVPPERSARIAAQKIRLAGMDLSCPLESSFWLYDTFSNMLDSGELKYVAPNRCLTRQLELFRIRAQRSAGSRYQLFHQAVGLHSRPTGLCGAVTCVHRFRFASKMPFGQWVCRRALLCR